ncbi:MAG: MFS transporter, partial [Bradyrhizobium sp.]|nr:MFS transporter [Bradyrhizobium sp.]
MTILSASLGAADAAQSQLLRRSYRARLLTILLLANTLSFADRAILSAVVEPIRHELGVSDLQIGMLQGLAFAVMYSLTGIPIGYLAERRSRIGILTVCIMVFSVATGLCGLAAGFVQLFLLRVLVGVGEGGYMPPATSLVADHYKPERRASA